MLAMLSKTKEVIIISKHSSSKNEFSSKIGFILAAAGSSVGLGNLWRFPYLAAKYGGGFFLLVYLVLAVTMGFALMLTEIAIGRKTGKSVIGAYTTMNKKFKPLGFIAAAVPILIFPYYCVIGGWVLKYMATYIVGDGSIAATVVTSSNGETVSFFENFISTLMQPTVFFSIYVLINSLVILLGVKKGIEKISKIFMPLLVILILAIAAYIILFNDSAEGLSYYLLPNFENFTFSDGLKTVAAAMGQIFYSMSLAMGIMVTYGSYMRKEDSLENSVRHIELFDTLVAFLAGIIIVPAVFIFSNGDANAINAGPSLMFITLPKVFNSMPFGDIIGVAFFVLVAIAALTSSISLMETVVAIISEKFKLSRKTSCLIVTVFSLIVGMFSVFGYNIWSGVEILGMQILDFFDFISNNILMPIVALLTCILVGFVVGTKYVTDEVLLSQKKFKSEKLYKVMITFICPICMLIILITPFITTL